MKIADIDRTTPEGRLLYSAIAIILVETKSDKTPDEILELISYLADVDSEANYISLN